MFNIDKRTMYIVLGIMLLINVLTGGRSIEGIILALPAVIIAMTFHEFAHAWVATKLGDDTPKIQGRLNLNPMSHIDPIGILCLIIVGFGWGRPVQINPRNFDGKYSISKAEAMVASAGPIMNFILAFIFLIIFKIVDMNISQITTQTNLIKAIISYIVLINIGLGVFNLIPIYPLDGSKILNHFISYRAKEWLMNNQYILTILLFFVVYYTGVMGYLSTKVYDGMAWLVNLLFGLFT